MASKIVQFGLCVLFITTSTLFAEEKKRMVFFDVYVDGSLTDIVDKADILTDSLESSLTSIPELEVIPKAVRDADWQKQGLSKEDCNDEACQLLFARATLKVDYSTTMKVRDMRDGSCFISIKVMDTATQSNVHKDNKRLPKCNFDSLYSTVSNMSPKSWPPGAKKRTPPPGPNPYSVDLGINKNLQPVPDAPNIADISSGLSSSGAIDTDLDADLIVLYYDALDTDKAGKRRPLSAASAWEQVFRYNSSKNPYKEEAMRRAGQWREYHNAVVERERLEKERKELEKKQKLADTSKVKKLVGIANFPIESKTKLVQKYIELYGVEEAYSILQQVNISESIRANIYKDIYILDKHHKDLLRKKQKQREKEEQERLAAIKKQEQEDKEEYKKTHGVGFSPMFNFHLSPLSMWDRTSDEFSTWGLGVGGSLDVFLNKKSNEKHFFGPTLSYAFMGDYEDFSYSEQFLSIGFTYSGTFRGGVGYAIQRGPYLQGGFGGRTVKSSFISHYGAVLNTWFPDNDDIVLGITFYVGIGPYVH